jgi:hypothetical protein
MARIAIMSDVHADLHALRDALGMIDALGCDRVVCADDVVDYGIFPEETISLVRERKIPCVRGNHDRWATSSGGALSHDEQDGAGVDATSWDLSRAAQHDELRRLVGGEAHARDELAGEDHRRRVELIVSSQPSAFSKSGTARKEEPRPWRV